MVVPSSSVNMERSKDGNVELMKLDAHVNIYVRNCLLLLVFNLTK